MQYAYTAPRSRRPMDKIIKTIKVADVSSGAQTSTTLATATYPGTIVGLRWELSFVKTTNSGNVAWAIVLVREGASADTITLTDAAAFYQPEQNVLACGVLGLDTTDRDIIVGDTKAMRKLQGGDQLLFLTYADVVSCASCSGTVQFFVKT